MGQQVVNSESGNYFQGIHITSGIFQLWRSSGLMTQIHLKYACSASLLGTILSLGMAFYSKEFLLPSAGLIIEWCCGFGLSCISWSAHQIHISLPANRFLDSGIDPVVMPCPQALLYTHLIQIILTSFIISI